MPSNLLSAWPTRRNRPPRRSRPTDEDERKRLEKQFDRLQHELHQRDAYNLDHRIERILGGLGFSPTSYQQPVDTLSGGQQNRLLLAKLLLAEPDLMLLDEPSNHLDIEATEWLEDFLVGSDQAMIIVSHDRYFLDRVTNRTFELFHGTVDAYTGNFSAYWKQKAERVEVQRRTYEKQQDEIAKTEEFIRRTFTARRRRRPKIAARSWPESSAWNRRAKSSARRWDFRLPNAQAISCCGPKRFPKVTIGRCLPI